MRKGHIEDLKKKADYIKERLSKAKKGSLRYQKLEWELQKTEAAVEKNSILLVEPNNVTELSDATILRLSMLQISKNHTGRWGVIVGSHSRHYDFMHEDVREVFKYIRKNFNEMF